MSVAYKYACFQLLSIPTEETMADPDDSNEQLKPTKSKARRIQELIDGTDVLPKQITEFIVANFGSAIKVNDLTDEQFNKLYSAITQYIKGDN